MGAAHCLTRGIAIITQKISTQRVMPTEKGRLGSAASSVGSVALLVFLAGAAGAGIVASDLRAGAHWLGRLGLRGAGGEFDLGLLAAVALFDFAGFLLGGFGGLHEEEEAHGFGVNALHHVFKQREGFLFEFDQRIPLPVARRPMPSLR